MMLLHVANVKWNTALVIMKETGLFTDFYEIIFI